MRFDRNLQGNLDQHSTFFDEPLPTEPNAELWLHMEQVGFINSTGIMRWMRWCKSFPATLKVFMTSCPMNFVIQGDLINRFFPENCRIESVRTFFICERDGQEQAVLLKRKQDYFYAEDTDKKVPEIRLPQIPCPHCSQILQPDFTESKVFAFLKPATP